MNIYLIRHGEKERIAREGREPMLSARGIRQAQIAGVFLQRLGVDRIYTSPLVRAVQSAEEINREMHLPVETRPELREIDQGRCEGLDWQEAFRRDPDFRRQFEEGAGDIAYPGGESGGEVWDRVRTLLEEIAAKEEGNVALVTHMGVIRPVVCGIMGIPQCRRFDLGAPLHPGGITTIVYDQGRYTLHCFNDGNHLDLLEI